MKMLNTFFKELALKREKLLESLPLTSEDIWLYNSFLLSEKEKFLSNFSNSHKLLNLKLHSISFRILEKLPEKLEKNSFNKKDIFLDYLFDISKMFDKIIFSSSSDPCGLRKKIKFILNNLNEENLIFLKKILSVEKMMKISKLFVPKIRKLLPTGMPESIIPFINLFKLIYVLNQKDLDVQSFFCTLKRVFSFERKREVDFNKNLSKEFIEINSSKILLLCNKIDNEFSSQRIEQKKLSIFFKLLETIMSPSF